MSVDLRHAPWQMYSLGQRWTFLGILFLVTTSNYFDYYVVSIVLDPIKQEFQVSDTMLGLLGGFSFAVFYAVAALPLARWADRGNRSTITALTLAGWSVMTVICGFAQSFWQLLFARLGVALTEPGAAPPAQSLVADYFPPERRATALAVLVQGGSAAGYCAGIGLGGYIAATHGWRSAFLLAGIPGIILAFIVKFALAEPRRRMGFPATEEGQETALQSLAVLKQKRSYVLALAGLVLFQLCAYGTSVFLPSFMIRTLHATLEQVSVTWGFAVAIAMLLGAAIGGYLADRLSRRDTRWYAWLPALSFGAGAPMYWATFSTKTLWTFIAVDFPSEVVLAVGYSVSFAALHAVCGHRRRAMATAMAFFMIMLIGCGFGPLLAGVLSDAFTAVHGQESLRFSLLIMVFFLFPASAAFYFAGRAMPDDLED